MSTKTLIRKAVAKSATRPATGPVGERLAKPATQPATTVADWDPALLERPRIAANVEIHEPIEAGAPWVLQRGNHQHFRLQPDMARLVRAMDGRLDHSGLAEVLGPPWTAQHVATAVRKLAETRVLDDGKPAERRSTWFRFVPPMTLQFTLLRPERLLTRLAPLIRLLAGRASAAVAALFVLGGVLALAAMAPELDAALGRPLPFLAYFGVLFGVLATTAVHEVGHGAVLTYYGGRPSRMGFMLFYMSPAFFCDVSDGWRLSRKEQRVRVALAGIATQTVIAGAAALTALFLGPSDLRDAVLVFAVATYTSGVVNLLPFVKLDGYIALMSHLDVPHLRDRAMTDARRFLAGLLFGGRDRTRELDGHAWAVAFGLACMAFPLYIVAGALTLWSDLFQRLGAVGTGTVLMAVCYLLYRLGLGYSRLVAQGRAAGAPLWRTVTATALLTAAAAAALVFVKLPHTIAAGYVAQDRGRVELVLPSSADLSDIRPDSAVRLYRTGLMTREQTGTASVAALTRTETTAPLSAFLPVSSTPLELPVVSLPLTVDQAPADRVGAAQVDLGELPLGEWLYTKYVAPLWRR
ncbi:daptide biosynthesis intramembrane metalloprotease [Streptomyces sp. NPDC018693]|uniref:daptide biosynthesis intramembrane metalloprotease n=1 Tax=unclassified Streptomyces TaxID=2593676 RepID=UPI00379876B9